jgi:hypothetical protein
MMLPDLTLSDIRLTLRNILDTSFLWCFDCIRVVACLSFVPQCHPAHSVASSADEDGGSRLEGFESVASWGQRAETHRA